MMGRFSVTMSPLNLDRLQSWIDQGKIDATKPITMKELVDSRCLHGVKDGVKLLGDGAENFTAKIDITVSRASKVAIEAIEKAGGKVTTRYFNKLGMNTPGDAECPDADHCRCFGDRLSPALPRGNEDSRCKQP